MIFERKKYLDELIAGRGNGLVKIITGGSPSLSSFLAEETTRRSFLHISRR